MGGPVMLKEWGHCGYFNGRDVRGGGEGEERREREAGREEEDRKATRPTCEPDLALCELELPRRCSASVLLDRAICPAK